MPFPEKQAGRFQVAALVEAINSLRCSLALILLNCLCDLIYNIIPASV